jgi:hypothetical protein
MMCIDSTQHSLWAGVLQVENSEQLSVTNKSPQQNEIKVSILKSMQQKIKHKIEIKG